jgi:hypothetical protein
MDEYSCDYDPLELWDTEYMDHPVSLGDYGYQYDSNDLRTSFVGSPVFDAFATASLPPRLSFYYYDHLVQPRFFLADVMNTDESIGGSAALLRNANSSNTGETTEEFRRSFAYLSEYSLEDELNRMDQINQRSIAVLPTTTYSLGTCSMDISTGTWRQTLEIAPSMWSMYPYHLMMSYIQFFRCGNVNDIAYHETIQIMQKQSDWPATHFVIKTTWIRLIQRTWKRVYKERMRAIALRCSLACQRRMELRGRCIDGAQYIPGLRGMMVIRNNVYISLTKCK